MRTLFKASTVLGSVIVAVVAIASPFVSAQQTTGYDQTEIQRPVAPWLTLRTSQDGTKIKADLINASDKSVVLKAIVRGPVAPSFLVKPADLKGAYTPKVKEYQIVDNGDQFTILAVGQDGAPVKDAGAVVVRSTSAIYDNTTYQLTDGAVSLAKPAGAFALGVRSTRDNDYAYGQAMFGSGSVDGFFFPGDAPSGARNMNPLYVKFSKAGDQEWSSNVTIPANSISHISTDGKYLGFPEINAGFGDVLYSFIKQADKVTLTQNAASSTGGDNAAVNDLLAVSGVNKGIHDDDLANGYNINTSYNHGSSTIELRKGPLKVFVSGDISQGQFDPINKTVSYDGFAPISYPSGEWADAHNGSHGLNIGKVFDTTLPDTFSIKVGGVGLKTKADDSNLGQASVFSDETPLISAKLKNDRGEAIPDGTVNGLFGKAYPDFRIQEAILRDSAKRNNYFTVPIVIANGIATFDLQAATKNVSTRNVCTDNSLILGLVDSGQTCEPQTLIAPFILDMNVRAIGRPVSWGFGGTDDHNSLRIKNDDGTVTSFATSDNALTYSHEGKKGVITTSFSETPSLINNSPFDFKNENGIYSAYIAKSITAPALARFDMGVEQNWAITWGVLDGIAPVDSSLNIGATTRPINTDSQGVALGDRVTFDKAFGDNTLLYFKYENSKMKKMIALGDMSVLPPSYYPDGYTQLGEFSLTLDRDAKNIGSQGFYNSWVKLVSSWNDETNEVTQDGKIFTMNAEGTGYIEKPQACDAAGKCVAVKFKLASVSDGVLVLRKLVPNWFLYGADTAYPVEADATTSYNLVSGVSGEISYDWDSGYGFAVQKCGTGNLNISTSMIELGVFQANSSSSCGYRFYYTLSRGFMQFDTSAIGSGTTITNATYNDSWWESSSTNSQPTTLNITPSTASSSSLTSADYGAVSMTSYSSCGIGTNVSTGGWCTVMSLNAGGISNINKTGRTKFAFIIGPDLASDNSYNRSYGPQAWNGGVTLGTLSVTYTLPNTTPTIASASTSASYLYSGNATAFPISCNTVTDPDVSQTDTCQGSWDNSTWYTIGTSASPLSSATISGSPNVSTWTGYPADGSRTLYVRVTDGTATSINQTFTVTKDITAPTITSTAPASSAYSNTQAVSYTLSEAVGSASIVFTRTSGTADGGSPHTCTLQGTTLNTGAHSALTMATGANACSAWTALVDGAVYSIAFNATDLAGNTATTVTNTGVTYDITAPTISSVSPAGSSYIASQTVSYTLSEVVASGAIVFTRTSGAADAGSPHTCAIQGTALSTGAHSGLTLATGANACVNWASSLVDGTTYTVTFNATDAAGNAATTVTSTSVGYDTSAPTTSGSITGGTAPNTAPNSSRINRSTSSERKGSGVAA